MRNCLKVVLALAALGLLGASSGFAQTRVNPYPNGLYDYAPSQAPSYAPGYVPNSGPSATTPQYAPGYGNSGDTGDHF